MKAMIMAAGYGERMRPISNRRPKPLLPVLGKPLIDYVVEKLTAAGITQVGINTHHLARDIVDHLQKRYSQSLQMDFSHEEIIRGTGGGMRGLRDFLAGDEPFLVHNGDVFSTVSLDDVIACHRQHAPLVTMVLVDYQPVNSVTVSEEGSIVEFRRHRDVNRKSEACRNFTFTGISVVDPAILDLIPDTIPYSIIDLYSDLLKKESGCIRGFIPHSTYWIDVGTPRAYLQAHGDILLRGKASLPNLPRALNGVHQASGCTVDPEARLGGFVSLGSNCRVEAGACLKNCIVWDNAVIESGTQFENGVIDGTWSYQPG